MQWLILSLCNSKPGRADERMMQVFPHIEYDSGVLWVIQRPRIKFQKGETARHPVLVQPRVSIIARTGEGGLTLLYLLLWVLILQTRVLEP